MRPPGTILRGDLPFEMVIRPLAVELAPCFWVIGHQSGLFASCPDEVEEILEGRAYDAPACRHTSWTCWRPHTFPRLAEYVYTDEWTCFYAMRCGEDEVDQRTEWIVRNSGTHSADFFDHLGRVADAFLMYVDGWWEFYPAHEEWQRKFRSAFPEAYERAWQRAGEPPD